MGPIALPRALGREGTGSAGGKRTDPKRTEI